MARRKFKAGDLVKYNGKYIVGCYTAGIEKAVVMEDENENGLMRIKILEHKDENGKGKEYMKKAIYFDKIDETIVIYRKGVNKVVALDKSTGKQAEATCSPADRFDFHYGVELAFKRLLNKEETRTKETYYNGTIQLLDKFYMSGKRVDIIDIKDGKFELCGGTYPFESIEPFKDFEEVKNYFLNTFDVKPIRVAEIEIGYGPAEKGDYIRLSRIAVPVSVESDTVYRVLENSLFYLDIKDINTDKVIKVPRVFVEYTILKNYKEVHYFEPYLINDKNRDFYGNIGDETPFRDAIGRPLRVGDTVELYNSFNQFISECPIISEENKLFVYGIKSKCNDDGTLKDGWKIILKRKFGSIPDGEVVDDVRYIKKER